MAFDVPCRLTLTTIFRPLSDDGFLTSFLPFRSTFGIFNLFSTLYSKVQPQRDSNPESSDSKSNALSVRLCGLMRSIPFLFFFCNEWLRWGVKWHTVLAIVSLCQSFSLLEIDICWAPVYFVWLKQVKLMWLDLFHLRTMIGIFDQEIEIYEHRGIWTSDLPFRKQTPFPLGCEDFSNSVSLQSMN